ncbi:SDR family NAD(P)-dependent oxidoreductase [Allobranchiibius sp. GilTou38]|uniref:SDR family NAD(P)-dependent oxidoreductase n=1 Tax=Allobranchiibius sp. GilTou38 TaxID=2815210 RepID=UPI001AA0BFE6|nr:SDR family NAD(P)-dependent oxidoreductase [Allobranchiibius sp. GilTou38]MBO1767150.1 SDR family oxidoreductase [Allobranchiibius sp. GilTou38]
MSAVVVGANGLIGNAVTLSLARSHAVWVLGRDAAALERLASSTSARITAVPLDATDDAALEAAIAQAAEAEGGLRVAVNNVGLSHRPTPLTELDLEQFDRVIATTLRAVAAAMKFELGHMSAGAAIVNVASSAGLSGTPGMSAYAAAKHGVVGLTRTAAIDYGEQGIRVNAVAPGPIESGPIMALGPEVRERVGGYIPLRRMGSAQEVANAVTWLASPQAGYVTGTTLSVDGGKTA